MAAPRATAAKIAKSHPAPPVSSTPSVMPAYPRSTTVKGLTFGAARQSVSFRMSR